MCRFILPAMALLALAAAPAHAQFEDLTNQIDGLNIERTRVVTLDIHRLAAKDAVARLSEACGVAMECDPKLAEKKVTLVAHQRPACDVGEAMALALVAKWHRDGQKFLLQPQDPVLLLSPQELTAELQSAFPLGDLMPGGQPLFRAEGQALQKLFTPDQLAAIQGNKEGVPFSSLSPQQQQQLAGMLGNRIGMTTRRLPYEMSQMDAVDGANLRMYSFFGREVLLVRTATGFSPLMLNGGRGGRPAAPAGR